MDNQSPTTSSASNSPRLSPHEEPMCEFVYFCRICRTTWKNNAALIAHMRKHGTYYICNLCPGLSVEGKLRFKAKYMLEPHFKRVHKGIPKEDIARHIFVRYDEEDRWAMTARGMAQFGMDPLAEAGPSGFPNRSQAAVFGDVIPMEVEPGPSTRAYSQLIVIPNGATCVKTTPGTSTRSDPPQMATQREAAHRMMAPIFLVTPPESSVQLDGGENLPPVNNQGCPDPRPIWLDALIEQELAPLRAELEAALQNLKELQERLTAQSKVLERLQKGTKTARLSVSETRRKVWK